MSNMKPRNAKRSRHSDVVDPWLEKLGLYRKNVAYDETCFFRAISEQMYGVQVYHERVRKECIDYGRINSNQFIHLANSSEEWFERLRQLEQHMAVCGEAEIELISRKYNKDVWIFDGSNQQQSNVTQRGLNDRFLLCLMPDDHYDVVYEKEHIVTAGVCQSIIYTILYENVYQLPNVLNIAKCMLYDKTISTENLFDDSPPEDCIVSDENKNLVPSNKVVLSNLMAPFPFKVAKALDPELYRNIEYDSWTEVRRELRLGAWYYGDDKLILGTKCVYTNPDNISYECYIQDVLKDEDKYVIFITKTAERLTVNSACLSPEYDAKPWPLPYRFTKNIQVIVPPEERHKSQKKKKVKHRTQSCSEVLPRSSNVTNVTNTEALSEEELKAFVGVPLLCNTRQDSCRKPQSEGVMTPPNGCVWEMASWNPFMTPTTTESFSWPPATSAPQTPQPHYNYSIQPMVASAPVTPDVVPYHEVSIPVYYSPQVDHYQNYGPWVNSEYNSAAQQNPGEEAAQQTSMTGNAAAYVQPMPETFDRPPPTMSVSVEQNHLSGGITTLAPTTPQQMDVYSPMMAITPGTPIIYHQPPPQEPSPIYTQVESPQLYMSPGAFVYPPTPPSSWFPPGINSQGFIFPPPVSTSGMPQQ